MEDTRNLVDEFKGRSEEEIKEILDGRGIELEVAIENIERDFNMGTIVRNANAFGVRKVHVIGRRQWNKRGAMMTYKYLDIVYYENIDSFAEAMNEDDREIIAIDNIDGAQPLGKNKFSKRCVLVFGSESSGISEGLAGVASRIIEIEQFGSTRSVNVGVASGIAMYRWVQDYIL